MIAIPAAVVVKKGEFHMRSPARRSQYACTEWRSACSSVDDQPELQSNGDKSTVLAPVEMACVSLIGDAHETGWSGYEAKGDHARSNGNWSDAVKAYARAVELLGQTTAQEGDLDMASLLNKLGAMHSKQHDMLERK